VVEYTSKRGLQTRPAASAAVAEPVLIDVEAEPVTETFLEIIDREWQSRRHRH
jgi:hypothetical protein